MAIPDYQSIMLPLLKLTADGEEHTLGHAVDALARQFDLTEEEKKELYPTGQKAIFDDRVAWARTYLKQAGLLVYPKRGSFRITERGIGIIQQEPAAVGVRFLMQFPEFADFMRRKRNRSDDTVEDPATSRDTPGDLLEQGYRDIRRSLESELLSRVNEASPGFFEQLVVDVLMAMGYGGSRQDAGRALGRSGDGGIDGVIRQDKLGLDVLYIQAKRWDRSQVGEREIRDFVGALEGRGASKGIFITTSEFANNARDYVSRIAKRVILVDGEQLASLMVDHGVGVSTAAIYELKQVDNDYFVEE